MQTQKEDHKSDKYVRPPVSTGILTIGFIISSLFCLALISGLPGSRLFKNVLSVIFLVVILIAALSFIIFSSARTRQGRQSGNINKIITVIIIFELIFVFISLLLRIKGEPYMLSGDNINASSYSNGLFQWGYKDIETAVKKAETELSGNEIFRIDGDTYAAVFYCDGEKINTAEFQKENGKYYKYGERKIIFCNKPNMQDHTTYTDEETILADISQSLLSDNDHAVNQTGIYPVYGVTKMKEINSLSINNQPVDYIKEIQGADGSIYYFWFIQDLKVHEIKQIYLEPFNNQ